MLPVTNPSRTGRRILKRLLYSTLTLRDAFMILLGKVQPTIAFTVEEQPCSVYFNFRIRPDRKDAFSRYINLANGLELASIRCLEGEEPDLLLTLNVYRVSGLVSGLRAEWSTYIRDAEGKPRYMVVEARCGSGSMDPVNLFTQPDRVEHVMTANSVDTLVASNEGDLFRSGFVIADDDPSVAVHQEWIIANDTIYWRNGIYDRTYYDASMIDAPVRSIPLKSVTIRDLTHWAPFLEPEPKHVLKYEGPLHFMINPWVNI